MTMLAVLHESVCVGGGEDSSVSLSTFRNSAPEYEAHATASCANSWETVIWILKKPLHQELASPRGLYHLI
jgi:hypothetical protein